MCPESENHHFLHIFFQNGYLTCYSTYLLENVYVHSLYMEGRVSQNYDIGLRFCFIVCIRFKLGGKYKK